MYGRIAYYLIACLLLMLMKAGAQPQALRYDSALVRQVRPPVALEQEVFADVDLGFAKKGEGMDMNPIGRFFAWLLEKLFGGISISGIRNAQWLVIAFLLVAGTLILWWLFRKGEFGSLLKGNARQSAFNFTDVDEDISGIDFDDRIKQAAQSGNWRLVIRWLYLKQLYLLNERGLISWQPHKTNMDYAAELSGSPMRQSFREISRIYEYAWYGDYPVNETLFRKVEGEFVQFEKQMHA